MTPPCIFFIDEAGWHIVRDLAPEGSVLVFDPERYPGCADLSGLGMSPFPYRGRWDIEALLARMASLSPPLGVVASFNHVLPPVVFNAPPHGMVNIHSGAIPEYRGANTLQWAIINGESEFGVTLHYVDAGIDTGPVITAERVAVEYHDSAVTLRDKIIEKGRALLAAWLPRLAQGRVAATPQSEEHARYWPRRKPEDGRIDWTRSDEQIRNLVRALVPPWPGAFYEDRAGNRIVIDSVLTIEEIRILRAEATGKA